MQQLSHVLFERIYIFYLQLVESFTSEDVGTERLEYRNNDNSSLKVTKDLFDKYNRPR